MTVLETGELMDLFTAAYPRNYAGMTEQKRSQAVKLWWAMLKDYPLDVVILAAKTLIASQKFPPAISEVIEKIRLLTQARPLDEGEAWGLVQRAIANAGYHAQEEYERLPASVQAAVGSPNVLRQWAMVELDDLETVVHSNFIKAFRSRAKADAEYKAIPADVRVAMRQLGGGIFEQLEAGT